MPCITRSQVFPSLSVPLCLSSQKLTMGLTKWQ